MNRRQFIKIMSGVVVMTGMKLRATASFAHGHSHAGHAHHHHDEMAHKHHSATDHRHDDEGHPSHYHHDHDDFGDHHHNCRQSGDMETGTGQFMDECLGHDGRWESFD